MALKLIFVAFLFVIGFVIVHQFSKALNELTKLNKDVLEHKRLFYHFVFKPFIIMFFLLIIITIFGYVFIFN